MMHAQGSFPNSQFLSINEVFANEVSSASNSLSITVTKAIETTLSIYTIFRGGGYGYSVKHNDVSVENGDTLNLAIGDKITITGTPGSAWISIVVLFL